MPMRLPRDGDLATGIGWRRYGAAIPNLHTVVDARMDGIGRVVIAEKLYGSRVTAWFGNMAVIIPTFAGVIGGDEHEAPDPTKR